MKKFRSVLFALLLVFGTFSAAYAVFTFNTQSSVSPSLNVTVDGYADIGELESEVTIYQDEDLVENFVIDNSKDLAKNYALVVVTHFLPTDGEYTVEDIDYDNFEITAELPASLQAYFEVSVTQVGTWEFSEDEEKPGATATFKVQLTYVADMEPENMDEYNALVDVLEALVEDDNSNLITVDMTLSAKE